MLTMAPPGGGPTALRIMLGNRLRGLREARGLTRKTAGNTIRASDAKMSRLELGRVGYKQRDVADLITLYGVEDPEEREVYLSLAHQANAPGWWHKYGEVLPSWFETYVGLEQAAAVIRSYQVQFVPGLFQTDEYARAVIHLGYPGVSEVEIDMRANLRMARQNVLDHPGRAEDLGRAGREPLRRPSGWYRGDAHPGAAADRPRRTTERHCAERWCPSKPVGTPQLAVRSASFVSPPPTYPGHRLPRAADRRGCTWTSRRRSETI